MNYKVNLVDPVIGDNTQIIKENGETLKRKKNQKEFQDTKLTFILQSISGKETTELKKKTSF